MTLVRAGALLRDDKPKSVSFLRIVTLYPIPIRSMSCRWPHSRFRSAGIHFLLALCSLKMDESMRRYGEWGAKPDAADK